MSENKLTTFTGGKGISCMTVTIVPGIVTLPALKKSKKVNHPMKNSNRFNLKIISIHGGKGITKRTTSNI